MKVIAVTRYAHYKKQQDYFEQPQGH